MSVIDPMYSQLSLSDKYLQDPLLLAIAWKKAHDYIRTANWYAYHFELDQSALNLAELCDKWATEVANDTKFSDLKIVPAPKSVPWSFFSEEVSLLDGKIDDLSPFCVEWQPKEPGDLKLRPLAHMPIKEQSVLTLVMMCLANEVETLQGDPATDYAEVHRKNVVSYGNRLYCSYNDDGEADHSYGATTTYSKYFTDYRGFLRRPYYFANNELIEVSQDEEVYLIEMDLRQFFDLVDRSLLIDRIREIATQKQNSKNEDMNVVNHILDLFKNWKWSEGTDYSLCETDLVKAEPDGLPQGLVASGFLSNIYMLDFDSCMRKYIGKNIASTEDPGNNGEELSGDIRVVDYCRYVDDMRLVVVGPSRKKLSSSLDCVKTRMSDLVSKELKGLKLEINPEKTKVEVFRGKSVGISKTLEDIQAKASGPISMEDTDEQLSQLESLLVLSGNEVPNQSSTNHRLNRLALIEKNIFDIREDTLKRFAANKISRMLARKRHFTARDTNENGLPLPGDWDYLQERLARRLIACWSYDPALVLLLKKGLELFPSPTLLEPILEQLEHVMQRKNLDLDKKRQAAVAKYCLAEVFRHSATVIHRKDFQAIPAQADIDGYFEILQGRAVEYLKEPQTEDFDILMNQANFLLLVRLDTLLDMASENPLQDLIFKLAKGFRNIDLIVDIDSTDIATCVLLASQLVSDMKPVLRATASLLDRKEVDHVDVLRKVAIQDASLVRSIVLHARPLRFDWMRADATKKLVEALYVNVRPSAKALSEIRSSIAIYKLSSRYDNPLSNEMMALKLILALLDKDRVSNEWEDVGPEEVIDLAKTTVVFEGYSIPPRFEDFDKELKINDLVFCQSVATTVGHLRIDHLQTRILQRVALCIRAVLAGSSDPTGFGQSRRPRMGYRGLKSNQFKRQFGLMTTPESLAGENAQFSGWLTTLVAKLLRWPGVHVNDQGYKWPNQELNIDNVCMLVKERLEKLKSDYCRLAGIPGLTELVTPSWNKDKTSLTVAMVQSKLPFKADFGIHGIYLNSLEYRAKHRRHVSRVAQLVVHHIEAQNLDGKKGSREQDIDIIVWPELSVHEDDIDVLIQLSQKTHAIVLAGLGFIDQQGVNPDFS